MPATWICLACRERQSSYDRLIAAWSYEEPLDAVIRGLKFEKLHWLGAQLATAMISVLGTKDLGCHDVVVPVPLHWRRYWRRGFNQAEAIARPLAAGLRIPVANVLQRHHPTRPQTGTRRQERLRNLSGAFRLKQRTVLTGQRVLLVDDVFTTGATLNCAATELRKAEPALITVLAAARTPAPYQPARSLQ